MATNPAPARRTPLADRLHAMCRERPLVVGHRGAAATHPENTSVSFAAGLDAGAELIEFDVRATRDGHLVCLHDETLDRTTDARARFGGRGHVLAARTLHELGELDAGGWKGLQFAGEPIPTLAHALETIHPRGIAMIEHKAGSPETFVALLRELGLVEDVLLQSFDWEWVAAVHALEPRLTLGALGSREFGASHARRLAGTGASFVHWAWDRLRLAQVDVLRASGYLMCTYTVDAELAQAGAIAAGIDLVTTNRPDRLRALVDRGTARGS